MSKNGQTQENDLEVTLEEFGKTYLPRKYDVIDDKIFLFPVGGAQIYAKIGHDFGRDRGLCAYCGHLYAEIGYSWRAESLGNLLPSSPLVAQLLEALALSLKGQYRGNCSDSAHPKYTESPAN